MQSFQVLGGKHFEKGMKGQGHVTRYEKGDVVKSLKDLRKLFPNKFELVVNTPPVEPETGFKVVSLGRGQYNVVNTVSKDVLNEEPLTKSEAEELVKSNEGD